MSGKRGRQARTPAQRNDVGDEGDYASPSAPPAEQKAKASTGKRKKAQANGAPENKGLFSLRTSLQEAGNEARRLQRAYEQEANKIRVEMSSTEIDAMVAKVIRYILFKHHQHPNVPILRKELNTTMDAGNRARVNGYIIALAQARMAGTFGLHMQEISRKTRAGDFDINEGGGTMSYVLTSLLPKTARQHLLPSPANPPQHALLLTVLALIHLNLGRLTEQELWRHLEELGVSNGNARHPQLGNVKDAIATMIKQRFVFESKTNSQDGEIRFYEWGEQALAQVNTEEMDQWVHDLCGVQRMTPAPAPQVKAERSRR